MFQRDQVKTIVSRITETKNPLIQVVVGPRQSGKSTMLVQALEQIKLDRNFVSADDAIVPSRQWLETEWQQARNMAASQEKPVVLIVDEIQKIPHWSNTVKALYDADKRTKTKVIPVLSGSSSLLIHKGLEDSLMGRFELIRSPHWSYAECKEAFGFTLDDYLYFGGYPGAAAFVENEQRWSAYLRDSIIEPTISQDVLALENIRKPALLKSLFRLGATYSAQELSYNKMLGQLKDAGNTITLAHYLDLLGKAGILCGIEKYSNKEITQRKSSPRLMVYDTSLMTAISPRSKKDFIENGELKGHLLESAVGARLLARAPQEGFNLYWWREKNSEVDFVVCKGSELCAIEVKSGNETRQSGMADFLAKYPKAKRLIVGGAASGACNIEDFLCDKVELFY